MPTAFSTVDCNLDAKKALIYVAWVIIQLSLHHQWYRHLSNQSPIIRPLEFAEQGL